MLYLPIPIGTVLVRRSGEIVEFVDEVNRASDQVRAHGVVEIAGPDFDLLDEGENFFQHFGDGVFSIVKQDAEFAVEPRHQTMDASGIARVEVRLGRSDS